MKTVTKEKPDWAESFKDYYEHLPSEKPETPKIQWPPVFYVALLNHLRLLRDRATRRARYQFNKNLRGNNGN